MTYKATLIPGDGIGPEVTAAARAVIDAVGVNIDWDIQQAGAVANAKYGDPLPEQTLRSIEQTRLALKGPTETPVGKGFRSINVGLRKEFDLYINLRPFRSFSGVVSRYPNINLRLYRENVEDFYVGDEEKVEGGKYGTCTGKISLAGSERLFRFAFEDARRFTKTKLVAVHKANIIRMYDWFLQAGASVAVDFPDIEYSDRIVDNMCMQLVINPYQFEAIAAPNLFGDIISDLCAGLVGGLGLAPGANIGDEAAIFEAVHGSAPDIAGKGIANPCAVILSAKMMLEHLGKIHEAMRIESAIERVLAEGKYVTGDINKTNPVGTDRMTQAIIENL